MLRLLLIFSLLMGCLLPCASRTQNQDAIEAGLTEINAQIAQEQKAGNLEKEGLARWKKIVFLKNSSLTKELGEEAALQMDWFRSHSQWDNYYSTWQVKANILCSLGRLQQGLQETQRMLNDAKERNNKKGRALAYKQIGVIYLNMKQTEPAVEALQHYAELIKGEDDYVSLMSNVYYRLAKAYDYDEAYKQELQVTNEWRDFLLKKVGKVKKPEIRELYHSCYLARTAAFIGLKKLRDAGPALDTAGHHAHLIKTALSLHHYYKMRARYNLALGDATNTLLYTDSIRMVTSEKDDHADELRAQALMMLGEGAEAAQIYQRLYHEKDSVFGHEARQHLDELNTLFQLDELKTEQQQTKFKYTLIAASSIVVALLVLLIFVRRSSVKQKKVNEQLRIANERAKESSKMKAEFIRNITHEIRTPLNILSGFTQVLTNPDMDLQDDEKKDLQGGVIENTERITKLVDRMLALSDANSETIIERHEQTDAQDIVSQAIERSKIALCTRPENTDSAIVFEYKDGQTAASVDLRTNKLYAVRVLAHLLENALKFTQEGSITLRMETTDSKVRFIVEDTGIGIPSDMAEYIFEEFAQLDSFAEGIGIGLTVARSVAQRMGGNLWLDPSYSQGARFIFELLRE